MILAVAGATIGLVVGAEGDKPDAMFLLVDLIHQAVGGPTRIEAVGAQVRQLTLLLLAGGLRIPENRRKVLSHQLDREHWIMPYQLAHLADDRVSEVRVVGH